MRVLIITQDYPSAKDTTRGIFIHHQAVALQGRGHNVQVVHYIRRLPFWRRTKIPYLKTGMYQGISVNRVYYYWPAKWYFDWGWCAFIAHQLSNCIGVVKKKETTVIYAQWLLPTGAACVRLKTIYNIPIVAVARGYDLSVLATRSQYLRNELDFVWREADLILGNGEWARRSLTEMGYDVSSRSFDVVSNFRDLTKFFNGYEPRHVSGSLRIITVGSLLKKKGIDLLLSAAATLRDLDYQIEIVGDGAFRSHLEKMALNMGIHDRISFLGKLNHSEISTVLHKSHVFVMPSRREGLPNALIEAMASGLACVASRVGGIPDVIEDGVNGLLVPTEDSVTLANSIRKLAESEKLRHRLGIEARNHIKHSGMHKNVDRLESALLSVASSSMLRKS